MRWRQAREQFPDSWLLIEAISARSDQDRREVDELAVVGTFVDSAEAMRRYLELHRAEPQRELYVAHSSREELEIEERRWVGARTA